MAGYIRLQEPITVTADQLQSRLDAANISSYQHVIVKIRVLEAAQAGVLRIVQAMVNEAGQYTQSNVVIPLDVAQPTTVELQLPERFALWLVEGLNGSATFMIDILGRE